MPGRASGLLRRSAALLFWRGVVARESHGQFRVKLGKHRPGTRQAVRDVASRGCVRLFPGLGRQIVDGLAEPGE